MRLTAAIAAACLFVLPALAGPNEDALIAADKAFNEFAQKEGAAAAFKAFAAPEAVMFSGSADWLKGPEAIEDFATTAYGAPGSRLFWEVLDAHASADGTAGSTLGRWTFVPPPDQNGRTMSIIGSYVTVWAKQPDGSYKFTYDGGTPDQNQAP